MRICDDLKGSILDDWYIENAGNDHNLRFENPFEWDRPLRLELRKEDAEVLGSSRCELSLHTEIDQSEHTNYCVYEFKMFLPMNYEPDIDDTGKAVGSEIVQQFHNVPDEGEEWTIPPLALKTYGDQYRVEWCFDANELSTTESIKANKQYGRDFIGSFIDDRGKWVTWKWVIKWGWDEEQCPFTALLKDDKMVWCRYGPNTTNDKHQNHFKIGIYKWDWAQGDACTSVLDKRVIYYKDVDIFIDNGEV